MNVQTLAAEAASYFESIRNGDARGLKDTSPDWVFDLVHGAHGDMMPDDYRYEMAEDALLAIADAGEEAEMPEPPVYTGQLLKWASSNLLRVGFADEAVSEYGWNDEMGICGALMAGYAAEQQEVLSLVLGYLQGMGCESDPEEEE